LRLNAIFGKDAVKTTAREGSVVGKGFDGECDGFSDLVDGVWAVCRSLEGDSGWSLLGVKDGGEAEGREKVGELHILIWFGRTRFESTPRALMRVAGTCNDR
jgi:hypothetical protein